MVTGSSDVDEIYHRMAVIRRERHVNVSESIAGAESVVDWGRYAWTYPWIALGAAAAVGYLLYSNAHPKAAVHPQVTSDAANPAEKTTAREPVEGIRVEGQERPRTGQNLLLAAWGVVFPVAVRAGQNYFMHWLEQQYATTPEGRHAPSPSAGAPASGKGSGVR